MKPRARTTVFSALVLTASALSAQAQAPLPPLQPPPSASPATLPPAPAAPPSYPPAELDRIVSPIALYPDPLLAQVLANAPWGRTWANRLTYVHPYTVRRYATRAAEGHRALPRSPRERTSQWVGHARHEEHR